MNSAEQDDMDFLVDMIEDFANIVKNLATCLVNVSKQTSNVDTLALIEDCLMHGEADAATIMVKLYNHAEKRK